MNALIAKAERAHTLAVDEIAALLADEDAEDALAAAADRVRRACVGDGVHLRGLIEFSNHCRCDCAYCGLRRDNRRAVRYRLTPDEIVATAEKAARLRFATVVLQSGEDAWFTAERLAAIVARIKSLGLIVTLSIGERPREDYARLKRAGADRFLLRIETTDPELYARLHPGMSLANRRRCLEDLRALGFEVGTGNLLGLPGQTLASVARDVRFFADFRADMVGLGPLIPNADTPLGTAPRPTLSLTRRTLAVARLLLPTANIPATTAAGTLVDGGRELLLRSGANVIMPNLTEGAARRGYALYPGKVSIADTPEQIAAKLATLGRTIL